MNKIMERCLIQTQIAYIYILRISLWHRCDACGKRSRGLTDMLCGLLSLGRRLLWSWLSLPANVGRKCFITYSVCLSLWLLLIFLCLQSRYGTRRLSTRSPPTSTSRPCRLSWPLTSPSTSRAALLQECFWKTWASRTSSGWSSPVSQHSHCNRTPQNSVHGIHDKDTGAGCVPTQKRAGELSRCFYYFPSSQETRAGVSLTVSFPKEACTLSGPRSMM